MNQAAKNLLTGNLLAFEEFTSYNDSDYDSSDCEEVPPKPTKPKIVDSNGKRIKPTPSAVVLPVKPPPKADSNHEVKPKDSFSNTLISPLKGELP